MNSNQSFGTVVKYFK